MNIRKFVAATFAAALIGAGSFSGATVAEAKPVVKAGNTKICVSYVNVVINGRTFVKVISTPCNPNA